MAGISDSMTLKVAAAFGRVRKFLPADIRLFLIKRDGLTKRFTLVTEITSAFFVSYSTYREQTEFEIATVASTFIDYVAQASHIGYGAPVSNQVEVYEIADNARDKIPPVGVSPTWKMFGVRMPNERYTIGT